MVIVDDFYILVGLSTWVHAAC